MTKEYLKMADVFREVVQPERFNYALNSGKAKYAAHAINSHDELVEEVERLRVMERVDGDMFEELVTVLQAIDGDFSDDPSHDAQVLLSRLFGES